MKSLVRSSLAFAAALVFASCGITKSKETAAKSVNTFHQRFNAAQFAAIYNAATPAFKKSAPQAQFMQFIQAVRRKLGAFKSATQSGWRTNATTSGTFVELTYNSQFEQGSAVETFTFVIS